MVTALVVTVFVVTAFVVTAFEVPAVVAALVIRFVVVSVCFEVSEVIGSAVPMLAVLHGQRDYSGEAGILRTSMISQLAVSVVEVDIMPSYPTQVVMEVLASRPMSMAVR